MLDRMAEDQVPPTIPPGSYAQPGRGLTVEDRVMIALANRLCAIYWPRPTGHLFIAQEELDSAAGLSIQPAKMGAESGVVIKVLLHPRQ